MPITITKIERQKKNKQRYSLYSEDKFLIGVSEETLLEFNLVTGKSLSNEDAIKIEQKEKFVAIREQAWRFLTRRMHSVKELRDKLINKGFEKDIIDPILDELKIKKYLDDNSFAVIPLKKILLIVITNDVPACPFFRSCCSIG